MNLNIKPARGYVFGEEIKEDSGAVVSTAIEDTRQQYKVLAIGEPSFEYLKALSYGEEPNREEIVSGFKIGDTVLIQKHAAEGDTPLNILESGFALFLVNRVMAVIEGDK